MGLWWILPIHASTSTNQVTAMPEMSAHKRTYVQYGLWGFVIGVAFMLVLIPTLLEDIERGAILREAPLAGIDIFLSMVKAGVVGTLIGLAMVYVHVTGEKRRLDRISKKQTALSAEVPMETAKTKHTHIKPWQGAAVVGVLGLMGHGIGFAGPADFLYFVFGTTIWGGLAALVIWFFQRKNKAARDVLVPSQTTGNHTTDEQWWYVLGETRLGPVSRDNLVSLHLDGVLSLDNLVWTEGMPQWLSLVEVDVLRADLLNALRRTGSVEPPPLPSNYLPKLPQSRERTSGRKEEVRHTKEQMKPHSKSAAITAVKWAAGLSAGFILGPIVMSLTSGNGTYFRFAAIEAAV